MCQAVLAILDDRDHLHGDVPGRGIQLEVAQDRPAQGIRQKQIEGDGGGAVFPRQCQGLLAAVRDQTFEPFVAREPEQHTRVMRIVVHDQEHVLGHARLNAGAIVVHFLIGTRQGEDRRRQKHAALHRIA